MVKKACAYALKMVQSNPWYPKIARKLISGIEIKKAGDEETAKICNSVNKKHKGLILPGPNTACFIARNKRKTVGYIFLVKHHPNASSFYRYWLSTLWVAPFYRRLGIGRVLMKIAMDEARAQKAKQLYILVNQANERALPLYIELGFTPASIPEISEYLEEEKKLTGIDKMAMVTGF